MGVDELDEQIAAARNDRQVPNLLADQERMADRGIESGRVIALPARSWRVCRQCRHGLRSSRPTNSRRIASGCSSCRPIRSSPRSSETWLVSMSAPAHAVVLAVDEKSQIQALHRTHPGLPMKCFSLLDGRIARCRRRSLSFGHPEKTTSSANLVRFSPDSHHQRRDRGIVGQCQKAI